ncbi:MAG: divalent-cation tolerance protein CutA [Candidatus Kaelpia aquatica]|nr:divalent-cation tolerance protein CutA [Candidatus Kaelpia aquatica]
MEDYIQVYTTTVKGNAEKIAKMLLSKRLAGCIQIVGPIKSSYRFKGKIEQSKEYLCIIKTKSSLFKKLEKAIKEVHSYELPEIIATAIVSSSQDYLDWLDRSLVDK